MQGVNSGSRRSSRSENNKIKHLRADFAPGFKFDNVYPRDSEVA